MRAALVRGGFNGLFLSFVLLTILTELHDVALSDHELEDGLGEIQGTGKACIWRAGECLDNTNPVTYTVWTPTL